MKKGILSLLMLLAFSAMVYADVVVYQDGTRKNHSEKVNFKNGPSVAANGTSTDVDFDNIVINPVLKTSNPCATIGDSTIFTNSSTGVPCYCRSGNDYAIYSATTRCF